MVIGLIEITLYTLSSMWVGVGITKMDPKYREITAGV